MNTLLWILQIALAATFAGAAALKLVLPREKLAATPIGGWVDDFPPALVKPLGVAELLGAIGVVVPPLVHIAPILTPIAACGLLLTMVGAFVTHLRRHEYLSAANTVVVAIAAGVVAWARFGPYAF
jgi:hypothetical protein